MGAMSDLDVMVGDLVDRIGQLRESTIAADWQKLAREVKRCADIIAFGAPEIIRTDITIGMRVRVQPHIQVAVARGHALPVLLPVSVPVTVVRVHDENGAPEYVMVEFGTELYGNRPWGDSNRCLAIVSRGELHSLTCRCAACFQSGRE